ncbi:efflux RND transporter periplasmic adaptor subunit [Sphingomonas changnyeongensis]|uniref:Efflux RND transporter periplasmic adaptor subunit n=1 Tax=Sphingomonas changnyeongensis TaxID=2698679 RepID=A0A7Z2NWI8_9SPHN|nr:efflux RND transporter periplasmic adaptor subunit [Sphingomonas changnyeongensis]
MTLATLSATVVQPPGSRVAVAAALPGLVRSVHVQPGQVVTRGQLLAVLVSRDAISLASDLAQAEAHQSLMAAEARRMSALSRMGVVAGSRADGAINASRQAAIAVGSARSLLAQTGAGRDGQVRLTAPIAGRVASMNMDAGASVDGLTSSIIIEAEGSRWLALQVPERLAGKLQPGMAVVTADGHSGRLETVASSLDPATRAFPARARISDDGPTLVSGGLVQVVVRSRAPDGAVSVPATAVVNEAGREFVFVKDAASFRLRPVTRIGEGDPAIISAGLKSGEIVATSNLPELRAEGQR